jgi:hypothetical protein
MASNKAEYIAALGVWDMRKAAGDFSVPQDMGTVAILCPYVERPGREELDRFPALQKEALEIADLLQNRDTEVTVGLGAQSADFKAALCDPTISDMVLIGHGCLSSVEVDNPATEYRLDWLDLAKMSDHLKTGRFVQRICGGLPRSFNAPLGLMVMRTHNRVEAPVGKQIMPTDLSDTQNQLIRPVTTLDRMEYADIKSEFPQRTLSFASRTHVALGALKQRIKN